MIAYVKGTLAGKSPTRAVVEAGGIGYELSISLTTYDELPLCGESVKLLAITAIREDTIRLYGFSAEEEADLFRQLLAVPGIGPKLALAILSGIRVDRFRGAVLAGDAAALSRVPGIGRKSAERLIVELRSKFEKAEADAGREGRGAGRGGLVEEATLALETLGMRGDQAGRAVERVLARRKGDEPTVEELVREVLSGV